MITQRVKLDVNNQQGPTIYARMGEKNLRQIVFILTRKDEESGENIAVDIPAGAVGQLRILKPSNNFVIADLTKATLESGSVIFTATLPEQAVTVGGLCYYDVRIEETNSKFIFSATGHMIVDDNVISSGVLEDVSEVNGLVFPDDFITRNDHVAVIDDTDTSTESTWSSSKISGEIADAIESIDIPPALEYTAVEKIVGKWFDKDLYAITYVHSTDNYVNGENIYYNLPSGSECISIEPHYCKYLYQGGWYRNTGTDITGCFHVTTDPDIADNPARIRLSYNIGASLNGSKCESAFTVRYIKEGNA